MPFSSLNPAGSEGRLVEGNRPRHVGRAGNAGGASLGCSSRFFIVSSKTSRELFCVAAAGAITVAAESITTGKSTSHQPKTSDLHQGSDTKMPNPTAEQHRGQKFPHFASKQR